MEIRQELRNLGLAALAIAAIDSACMAGGYGAIAATEAVMHDGRERVVATVQDIRTVDVPYAPRPTELELRCARVRTADGRTSEYCDGLSVLDAKFRRGLVGLEVGKTYQIDARLGRLGAGNTVITATPVPEYSR